VGQTGHQPPTVEKGQRREPTSRTSSFLAKAAGVLLLIATIGVASCQALFADAPMLPQASTELPR